MAAPEIGCPPVQIHIVIAPKRLVAIHIVVQLCKLHVYYSLLGMVYNSTVVDQQLLLHVDMNGPVVVTCDKVELVLFSTQWMQ